MRTVNSQKLQSLIRAMGHNAMARASVEMGVSYHVLRKLAGGQYKAMPKEDLQLRISEYFGVDREALFPLTAKKVGKAS